MTDEPQANLEGDWRICELMSPRPTQPWTPETPTCPSDWWRWEDDISEWSPGKHPTTNIADAIKMEDKISEKCLEDEYVMALLGIIRPYVKEWGRAVIDPDTGYDGLIVGEETIFELIHATPLERCQAAEKVLGEGRTET